MNRVAALQFLFSGHRSVHKREGIIMADTTVGGSRASTSKLVKVLRSCGLTAEVNVAGEADWSAGAAAAAGHTAVLSHDSDLLLCDSPLILERPWWDRWVHGALAWPCDQHTCSLQIVTAKSINQFKACL